MSNIYSLFLLFLPWTVLMDELGVGSFPDTISCSLVHGSSKGIYNLTPFLERRYLLSTIRCATCHNSIGDWSVVSF